jgi:hypothetical protein
MATVAAKRAAAVPNRDAHDGGRRFMAGLNMAVTLLSSDEARAMPGAGAQTFPYGPNVRASVSNSDAYVAPSTPRFNTASSAARSLSCRRRRPAIQTNGLNQ